MKIIPPTGSEIIRRAFYQKRTVYLYQSTLGVQWWDCMVYKPGVFQLVAVMRLKLPVKDDFPEQFKLVVHSLEYEDFAKTYGPDWARRNLILNKPLPYVKAARR